MAEIKFASQRLSSPCIDETIGQRKCYYFQRLLNGNIQLLEEKLEYLDGYNGLFDSVRDLTGGWLYEPDKYKDIVSRLDAQNKDIRSFVDSISASEYYDSAHQSVNYTNNSGYDFNGEFVLVCFDKSGSVLSTTRIPAVLARWESKKLVFDFKLSEGNTWNMYFLLNDAGREA